MRCPNAPRGHWHHKISVLVVRQIVSLKLSTLPRVAWRLTAFLAVTSAARLAALWAAKTDQATSPALRRAQWQQRLSAQVLNILGVELIVQGQPPATGMLVCNHVSYIDIAVIARVTPVVFVSKAEVRQWPVLGAVARAGGTLFVNRERRADVRDLSPQFAPLIAEGVVPTIFAEGTSTGGDRVLPFHSSLLAPAAQENWPITPAWLGYSLDEGSVSEEVAYWRDMTFLPHFLNLLSKPRIRAVLAFGEPLSSADRKVLAKQAHASVCALAQAYDEDGKWLSDCLQMGE